MHATIFQITRNRIVDNSCILDENTLTQGETGHIDCCTSISESNRKSRIKELVEHYLPKGMFSLVADDTLRYEGGYREWLADWVKDIQEKAAAVTAENVTDWIGARYQLEKCIRSPLDSAILFYGDDEGCERFPEHSGDFMTGLKGISEGDMLYIGGVLDCCY